MTCFLLDITKKEVSLSGIERLTDNAIKCFISVYLPISCNSAAKYNPVFFINKKLTIILFRVF